MRRASCAITLVFLLSAGCASSLPQGAASRDRRLAWLVGTWRTKGTDLLANVEITAVVEPSGGIVFSSRNVSTGEQTPQLPGHVEVLGTGIIAKLYDPTGKHPALECGILALGYDSLRTINPPNAPEGCGAPRPFMRVR